MSWNSNVGILHNHKDACFECDTNFDVTNYELFVTQNSRCEPILRLACGWPTIIIILFVVHSLQVLLSLMYTFSNDIYTLINYFNFVTWTSSGAVVAGMIWVRYKEPNKPRPFKVSLRGVVKIPRWYQRSGLFFYGDA